MIPESVNIEQRDRLAVKADLKPGGYLGEFLQRAKASWHGDEGIGASNHLGFPLMHRCHLDEVGDAFVLDLTGEQARWHHSGHGAPTGKNGIGNSTHQADGASAVDQLDAFTRQKRSERICGVDYLLVGAC